MEKLKRSGHSIIVVLFLVAVFTNSGIALAELPEPPGSAPWYVKTLAYLLTHFPEINGWFAAAMLFIMSVLRGAADLLMFVAKRTETKKDDKLASQLCKLLKWVGTIIGWFGLGSPKK